MSEDFMFNDEMIFEEPVIDGPDQYVMEEFSDEEFTPKFGDVDEKDIEKYSFEDNLTQKMAVEDSIWEEKIYADFDND